MLGRLIDGRWRIVKAIGRGGMGVVYEGQNVSIGKRVALKFIDAEFARDPEVTGRFQREARAASAVESTHIVEVFDTGTTDDGRPYLVMELLRGESLRSRIRRLGRLSSDEACHIVGQTLRGLQRAHAAGVIHRDLKPDNLFVVQRDDDEIFIKVLDFGISKVRRSTEGTHSGTLTRKGSVLGTPNYMAPEQAQGHADLDERADLFSVGAILFECLTGNPPHHEHHSYEAIIVAMCTKDAPDVRTLEPSVTAPLSEVVSIALARDRQDRFPSAEIFLEALMGAAPGAIPSRRTPFSLKQVSTRPTSDPRPTPLPDAVPTKTSWTSRDSHAAVGASAAPRRRLLVLGLGSGAAAFLVTLLVLALRPKANADVVVAATGSSVAPPVGTVAGTAAGMSAGATAGATGTQPPGFPTSAAGASPVMLHISGPPGSRVLVDGKVIEDGVLRGPVFSKIKIRVEAPGYEPREETIVLDGRPGQTIDLVALAPAKTAVGGVAAKLGGPGKGGASGAKDPKEGKDPGLKLKVDP